MKLLKCNSIAKRTYSNQLQRKTNHRAAHEMCFKMLAQKAYRHYFICFGMVQKHNQLWKANCSSLTECLSFRDLKRKFQKHIIVHRHILDSRSGMLLTQIVYAVICINHLVAIPALKQSTYHSTGFQVT